MTNSFFTKKIEKLTLADCQKLFDVIDCPKDFIVTNVTTLNKAGAEDIAFYHNVKYLNDLKKTKAGVCLVSEKNAKHVPDDTICLIVDDAYYAFSKISGAFYDDTMTDGGIHPTAVIDKNVEIGDNPTIGANVVISHAIIGDNVHILPGACIGQRGFGFATYKRVHHTVPQLGHVIIGNDVEIGANTCIDRGMNDDTVIGDMTKLDNMVQIGHNAKLGRGCFVAAQTGIAGSATIADYVAIGGQVGIAGHITIGNQVQIAAQSGVMKDVPDGHIIGGSPAEPINEWMKSVAYLRKMVKK